ncbi:hypothetical protein pah_c197o056 [Parachlamydia acanthamoebae str. Hall's coccus]|nr:hypothetical protein pah_c197o056 [Parachlamydia acanthamoebae str. Hall's coccus]
MVFLKEHDMSSPSFFSCVSDHSNKTGRFLENYLYLDGISGKLGARRFTVLEQNTIQEIRPSSLSKKQIFLTIAKLVSFTFFPLALVALVGKAIYRKNHTFQILTTTAEKKEPKPPGAPQEYLGKQWSKYKKNAHEFTENGEPSNSLVILEEEFKSGAKSCVSPDLASLADLTPLHETNSKVFFLPKKSSQYFDVSKKEDFILLKQTLTAAFATGKDMVVVRFSNHIHTVAAGFCSDGRFKIIDSMSHPIFNVKKFTTKLNQLGITDAQGKRVNFHGEYINTKIQRGGHECVRFAMLYCHQMAKKNDLEAYQEVNGAFCEGKLTQFEDYERIDGSSKIKKIDANRSIYTNFMKSWAYRTVGLRVNSWLDLPIAQLSPKWPIHGPFIYYNLKNNEDEMPKRTIPVNRKVFFNDGDQNILLSSIDNMPKEQEIVIPENASIRELINQQLFTQFLLFIDKEKKPRMFGLLPGQKLEVKAH